MKILNVFLFVSSVGTVALGETWDAIQQLKNQLSEQQQTVANIQDEVSSLLRDVAVAKGPVGAGGISLDIHFPGPKTGAGPEQAAAMAEQKDLELESTAPIPVMVVKPSSVTDVEEAISQVVEEEAAFTGDSRASSQIPMSMNVQSPEDIIDDAISRIDQLEAQKTHYKYDTENVRRNYMMQ